MSECCGNNGEVLITACAGASDVGFISDRAARMLSVAGKGRIYCLAGIGAQIPSFVKGAKEAAGNIVIDGCPIQCAKKIMDNNGIACDSFVITALGYKKGETGMSDGVVKDVFDKINGAVETAGGGGCGCGGKC